MLSFFLAAAAVSFSYCGEITVKEWTPNMGITGFSAQNNGLSLRAISSMPVLTSKGDLYLDAEKFKVLEIQIRSDINYATGKVFFRRIGDPGFIRYNSVEFHAGQAGTLKNCLIDLSRNPNWNGTIMQLALVPVDSEGSVKIESIKFFEPDFRLKFAVFWKEFFAFEKPLPRTINFIYGPRINGISVNAYIYLLIILISLLLIVVYWVKFNEPGKLLNVISSKMIIVCFIFWLLLDARTALDQFRSAVVDHQTFGGKSLEEKQALSTNGSYYDFYHYLRFCGEKIPSGSSYSIIVPPNAVYFTDKARYYLYPTYEDTKEAEYMLVYDPQRTIKTDDIPRKEFKRYADFGNDRYILKRAAGL